MAKNHLKGEELSSIELEVNKITGSIITNTGCCFVTNENNPKQSMCIWAKDVVRGYKYADYLNASDIPKRLFERE
jgi:hypothetical protein